MAMKPLTTEQKKALAALRASLGGVSEEKRNAQRHLLAARQAIMKMLETQPASIPQIAEALNMPSDQALWHVTGMRKYGKVSEAGEDGDYPLYAPVAYAEKPPAGH
jgi:predicted Rossmann fold nucleotide-binding protein DprA/Smf involved in DNA uptake